MSEIKVNSIKGVAASTAAITVNNTDGTCTANVSSINNGQIGGFRNLFINGAMQINQREDTGTLGYYNPVTASIYTLDRWRFAVGSSFDTNSARITQDTAGPSGFRNSWKIDIYNTQTPTGSQNAGVEQRIEAQNLIGLGYGTSAAKTMTLSFYVKSYKTGTYCVQIMQEDGSKYQLHEYSISQSNVWERKTITITGNTSDVINNDTGIGLRIVWALACGPDDHVAATSSWASSGSFHATSNQVNLWDNGSNDWFLTGCQLEIGTVATDFEFRSFGQELQHCGRYYQRLSGNNGTAIAMAFNYNTTLVDWVQQFPMGPMRSIPSFDQTNGNDYFQYQGGGNPVNHLDGAFVIEQGTTTQANVYFDPENNLTAGLPGYILVDNAAAYLALSAEL